MSVRWQEHHLRPTGTIQTDGGYFHRFDLRPGLTEYLRLFRNVWGILFDEPIPGSPLEFGVQHGSDLPFYFPLLNGVDKDPRRHGYTELVETMQSAVVRFVATGSPGDWPQGKDKVMRLSRSEAKAVAPPYRPGFEVLRDYLRPGTEQQEI